MKDREAKVREKLAQHYGQFEDTIAWCVRSALLRRGISHELARKNEKTVEELKNEVRIRAIKVIFAAYDPESAANPSTFVCTAAKFTAITVVDKFVKARIRSGVSLDQKTGGGDGETLADSIAEDEAAGFYRGAVKIRVDTELHLLKETLCHADWTIFRMRYFDNAKNLAIARALGWTREKLSWHLRGYELRLARLFSLRSRQKV